eukprot:m.76302 g.76302  ORF g.76302 m.76302 type:complete len:354 (-) comp12550_c0_seq3:716-1777(-)
MFISCLETSEFDFSKTTVVLPMVGIGNVAQLTIDLLLEETKAIRVGYLEHDALLPLVANSKDGCHKQGEDNVVTALEVYYSQEHNLTMLQIRSQISKAQTANFRKDLVKFLTDSKFIRVVVLSGSNSSERQASQLQGPQQRYILSAKMKDLEPNLKEMGWVELEPRVTSVTNPTGLFIHGGGMARSMFHSLCNEDVPVLCLVQFCNHGDTRFEALELASTFNQFHEFKTKTGKHLTLSTLLGFKVFFSQLVEQWQVPTSWELCLANGLSNELERFFLQYYPANIHRKTRNKYPQPVRTNYQHIIAERLIFMPSVVKETGEIQNRSVQLLVMRNNTNSSKQLGAQDVPCHPNTK